MKPGTLSDHLKLNENFDATINSADSDSHDPKGWRSPSASYTQDFENDSENDDEIKGAFQRKSISVEGDDAGKQMSTKMTYVGDIGASFN